MKFTIVCFSFLCALSSIYAQSKVRRLPSIINHPSLNCFAPYVSADGNSLLFVSDNGQDGALVMNYTSRETDWSVPVELPKHVSSRLNFLKGYALSADGKRMYFTCAKSPVIGGYDIFSSDLQGSSWGQPQNLMLPINSKTNDGSPSITPDGNTLYFMRCDKMDMNKASGCKLFVAHKMPNGQWGQPTELPAHINTGNTQTPRIMADEKTLIFSSDQFPGSKGGMDLYITKLSDLGSWSDPVPLDFVNTDKDDQYVSAAALGRYLLKETMGSRKTYELTEFLFPTELRPQGIMKVEVTTSSEIPAYINVSDLATGKRIVNGRPGADGIFSFYLPEGTKYELAVEPENGDWLYYSRMLDLTSDKVPQKEKVNVTLKKASPGDEITLSTVQFEPNSLTLKPFSLNELKRLARLVKATPEMKWEIQVLLRSYKEDSVQSAPYLTELSVDSTMTTIEDVDSSGNLINRNIYKTKNIYHNDRTEGQAKAIIAYLSAQGLPQDRFTYFRNAIAATPPEEENLIIKATARR